MMHILPIFSALLATAFASTAYWAYQEIRTLHEEYRYHQMLVAKGNPDADTTDFIRVLMPSRQPGGKRNEKPCNGKDKKEYESMKNGVFSEWSSEQGRVDHTGCRNRCV